MSTLLDAQEGIDYTIKEITTNDEELDAFLFSLGCYKGEKIVLVAKRSMGYVIAIKDGRYTIDQQLAGVIEIE